MAIDAKRPFGKIKCRVSKKLLKAAPAIHFAPGNDKGHDLTWCGSKSEHMTHDFGKVTCMLCSPYKRTRIN